MFCMFYDNNIDDNDDQNQRSQVCYQFIANHFASSNRKTFVSKSFLVLILLLFFDRLNLLSY